MSEAYLIEGTFSFLVLQFMNSLLVSLDISESSCWSFCITGGGGNGFWVIIYCEAARLFDNSVGKEDLVLEAVKALMLINYKIN